METTQVDKKCEDNYRHPSIHGLNDKRFPNIYRRLFAKMLDEFYWVCRE
jgi:hypothetical protein